MGKIALGVGGGKGGQGAADVRRFRDWPAVLRLSDRAASMSRPCILLPESWGAKEKPGMIEEIVKHRLTLTLKSAPGRSP